MSDVFSAAEIVDRTLKAAKRVGIYSFPADAQTPVRYAEPGQIIGVVESYLDPAVGRSGLWWSFRDSLGVPFYVKHIANDFDIPFLKDQGAKTDEEKRKEEELKNLPWYEQLIRKYGGYVIAGAIATAAVKGYFSKSNK